MPGAPRNSQLHWGDYMRGDDGGTFPFVRRRGPLALIGLSSAVPTPPFLATGRLGDAQLQKLAAVLDRSIGEDLPRRAGSPSANERPLEALQAAGRWRGARARWREVAPSSSSTATITSMR